MSNLMLLDVTICTGGLRVAPLDRCLVITDNPGRVPESLALLGLTARTVAEPESVPAQYHPDLVIIALTSPTSTYVGKPENRSLSDPNVWAPRILVPWFPPEYLWKLGVLENVTIVVPGHGDRPTPVLGQLRLRHLPSRFFRQLERHAPDMGSVMRMALRLVCLHRASVVDPPCRSVEALAQRAGCSTSYLYAQAVKARVNIGAVVRHGLLLEGMWLRTVGGRTWSDIAVALGFPSPSSWSNFVRRHWHVSPSDAEELSSDRQIELSIGAALRISDRTTISGMVD